MSEDILQKILKSKFSLIGYDAISENYLINNIIKRIPNKIIFSEYSTIDDLYSFIKRGLQREVNLNNLLDRKHTNYFILDFGKIKIKGLLSSRKYQSDLSGILRDKTNELP